MKANWKPIEEAPKDREILAAWGSKGCGFEGYDLITFYREHPQIGNIWRGNSNFKYPNDGYIILGWTELPPFSLDK